MKDKLNRLKTAHQSLLDSIDQIQQKIHSYKDVKPKLRAFEVQLLAYFEQQNNAFYEPLAIFYKENRADLKMIEFLKQDLKQLKIQLLTFFDQHSGEMGDLHAGNFVRDFREFSGLVLGRIKIEEEYLFPLIIKYQPLQL